MRKLTSFELTNESEEIKRAKIDMKNRASLVNSMTFPSKPKTTDFVPYHDDVEPDPLYIPDNIEPVDENGIALCEKPITDYWMNIEVYLPQGEENNNTKVIDRYKYADGNILGTYKDNPFLNTMIYDVEFPDDTIREYAASIIAKICMRRLTLLITPMVFLIVI